MSGLPPIEFFEIPVRLKSVESGIIVDVNSSPILGQLVTAMGNPDPSKYVECSPPYGNLVARGLWPQLDAIMYPSEDAIVLVPTSVYRAATWTGGVFGGGKFVVIASATNFGRTSPNGITWTPTILTGSNLTWKAIAYNGTLFCAIASGTSAASTSVDGINWAAKVMSASSTWNGIAWNGTVFAAVASASTVGATSPDGDVWSARVLSSNLAWGPIVWGAAAGLFVNIPTDVGNLVYQTSIDGATWISRTFPFVGDWKDIAWSGTRFCVVGTSGFCLSSADGINWTAGYMPMSATWVSVVWDAISGNFVAQSSSTPISLALSPDGITWTISTFWPSSTPSKLLVGGSTIIGYASSAEGFYSLPRPLMQTHIPYIAAGSGAPFVKNYVRAAI